MPNNNSETPKIDITRTELVWPGKYNSDGTLNEPPRMNLPFQVIERVNETRATREARKQPKELSLFDVWEGDQGETFEEGWRNKLIWGDNLLVMSSLLERYAGKIDLIYIDPPFATGADFSFMAEIGDDVAAVSKEQSLIEEKAYRDTWGQGLQSYLRMMRDRLSVARQLLSESGTIYVHCDWHVGHYLKLILDEIFGSDHYLNEIIWHYKAGSVGKSTFGKKHDTIHRYANSSETVIFNSEEIRIPYAQSTLERLKYAGAREKDVQKVLERGGKVPTDVWDIGIVQGNSIESQGFPTQKPERLLERIVLASSNPGALVADFFCGSGTTLAVAEKLGRRWIGCDLGRWAIHVSRKRLLGIEDAQPFELLNLGRYERQYWQGVTFGEDRSTSKQATYEYLAFILRLYGAEPISGLAHLHGKKDTAVVHVGSIDAPVTIDEVMAAVQECDELRRAELHVLGWDWEMGLYDLMVNEAKKLGVRLVPLQIPREVMEQQAVDRGDVRFFELAHLEVSITSIGLVARAELKDFVIPNTELVPKEIRQKVKKWSDYIDYWAVDWNFRDDTFFQGWVAYRTDKDRRLELTSDPHTYESAGSYTVVVKVVDIFGNDTSQAYSIEVG